MNTDIRISTEICRNPKIQKLRRRLTPDPFFNLICLWTWAAINRPDGDLSGMDFESIEIASLWEGEAGAFAKALSQLRFIVKENNDSLTTVNGVDNDAETNWFLKDWREHNPWVAESETRSDKSRFSRLAYVCPEIHAEYLSAGKNSISKSEYQTVVAKWKRTQNGNACKNKKK